MFRHHGPARFLPLVLALAGCVESEGPQIEVDPTQSEFSLPSGGPAIVRFTVHNRGDTYAYFSGCESPIPVVLEKEASGTWEEEAVYNTLCAGPVGEKLSLEPGASHVDSIPVEHANKYRLNIWFGSSISEPYAYAVSSGTFRVR